MEKFDLRTLEEIRSAAQIGENGDWEFKSAKGGLPGTLWETYSAMANFAGGTIVLGASESDGTAALDGVTRTQLNKLKKSLWDQLNNRQKVNRNILASSEVHEFNVDGAWLVAIDVRPAERRERPIYVGQNPFGGTFKRRHEGDYRCSDEEVRRMFADASDVPADARVLDGFGLNDLDGASISGFRNRFAASRPNHSWLALDDKQLLEQLGGWRKDRENGKEGITLAGLVMFGKHQAIITPGAAPNYMVDFRDFRGQRRPEDRWTDRLFPDGTWEANLFQFYQRCWPKLVADLKVPFAMQDGQRIDDPPVNVALREALVNAMIHTDYTVGGGIVIERYDDRYQFANPGTLLVSEAQLRQGGVSECRNRSLQRMFMFIGGGDVAGSGYARIQEGWKSQHWRAPRYLTQHGPDRVRLDMPMVSLMPEWAFDFLRQKIGSVFDGLNDRERVVLATALLEEDVTNARMQDLVSDHSSDITKLLRGLVAKGLLETDNQRRWTRYRLPASVAPRPDLFSAVTGESGGAGILHTGQDSSGLPADSSGLAGDSTGLPADSSGLAGDSSALTPKEEEWKAAAGRVAGKGKVPKAVMETVIIKLCQGRFLTPAELAALLFRSAPNLRSAYLTPLTRSGQLRLRYPDQPNRPNQAYTATDDS